MSPTDLGQFLRDGSRNGLRIERLLRHPPARVWKAITESSSLAAWLPVDLVGERRVGAPLTMPFWPEVVERYEEADQTYDGEVLAWDPPRLFAWTWGGDEIRFELTEVPEGTRLVFSTWFGPAPVEPWRAAAGWHECLALLIILLDQGVAVGAAAGEGSRWEPAYRALFEEGE